MRWDPYILLKGNEVNDLWKRFNDDDLRRVLFILGKGFDVRMNLGLESLCQEAPNVNLVVSIVDFTEGKNSASLKYGTLVEENHNQFQSLINGKTVKDHSLNTWKGKGRKKRRVGDRNASELFQSITELEGYTDIVVDISSLPRGIYFSLVGKLLTLISQIEGKSTPIPNLMILTAENAAIDSKVLEHGIDEDLHFQFGFGGGIETESLSLPKIWLPILGEKKALHFDKANQFIKPDEICPILPFPSKNPRRADDIFAEHYELFSDVLRIEPQNLMYVPEQNPFEVYRKLMDTIKNYQESLSRLNGCKAVISAFSSKLLSIGALLTAFEAKSISDLHVGILNVDSQGYKIDDLPEVKLLKNQSELFVIWLTGMPYN